jgi:tape measure domain-containing protein
MTFVAGAATSTLGIDIGGFREGMLQATSIAAVFPQTVTAFLANPLLGLVSVATQGASAVASAVTAIGSAVSSGLQRGVSLAGDAEQAQISFEVMLGSANKAQKMLADMTAFADKTPFAIPEIVSTGRMLLGFGRDADKVLPSIKMIGDVAAGTNQPLKDLGLIYAQIFAKGKLQGEEMLQLAERGVPIRRELEKLTGVSGAAFDKMVSDGKVSFELVNQAFENMTGSGGIFNNMMEKLGGSFKGLLSTLSDAGDSLLRGFGQGFADAFDLKGVLKSTIGEMSGLQDLAKGFGEDLGNALKPLAEGFFEWVKNPDALKNLVATITGGIATAVGLATDLVMALEPLVKMIIDATNALRPLIAALGYANSTATNAGRAGGTMASGQASPVSGAWARAGMLTGAFGVVGSFVGAGGIIDAYAQPSRPINTPPIQVNVKAGETQDQIAEAVGRQTAEGYRKFLRQQMEADKLQARVAEGL